jgi:carbon starvation protein
VVQVWDVAGWALWLAGASGVASLLAGVALSAAGRVERGRQLVSGGLAAVLLAAFGWGLLTSLYPAQPAAEYSWALYALAGAALGVAGVYLALGRFEEGVSSAVAALLVVGVGALAGALASGLQQGAVGALTVSLHPSTTSLQSGQELVLGVAVYGTRNPVRLNMSWGDGACTTDVVEPGKLYSYSHSYSVPGNEAARSYSILVEAVDAENPGIWGRNAVAVVVQNQGYCPLGWPFSTLCGLYRLVSYVLPALDLQKLVTCPLLPADPDNPVYGVYQLVLQVAMGGLGLFLAFAVVWSAVSRESALALPESLRDAVVAVALALLAPYAYNATAQVLNLVSYQLIARIDVGWALAWILLQVALGVVLGYFVPFAANYATFLAVSLFLASVAVYVRYVLILALAAASPLLAVAWLHPGLRGAVRHAVGLLAGLMLAGPLAAVFLVVLNAVVPGKDVVFGLLFPTVVGMLPTVLGTLGGTGVLTHVAGAVVGGVRQLGTAVAWAAQRARGGTATATAVAEAPVAVSAAPARLRLAAYSTPPTPAPILTPTTIREAAARARAAEEAAAEEKRFQELVLGTSTLTQVERAVEEEVAQHPAAELLRSKALPEPLRPAYEELVASARQEALARKLGEVKPPKVEVHPKWEAFKAGVKTLATHMGRQAWTNLRALATETKEALKHHLKEQAGIDLGQVAWTRKDVARSERASWKRSGVGAQLSL